MASDTVDVRTSATAQETTTMSHRDDASASHQYETVMRDSHAFFQRRDLASYDEAPLYFAWERLYKAANAAVRVDWLDESLGEFLERKHARVSPRRGLPPASLSLSASTARQRQRESARSSAFLRASLSGSRLHDPYARSSSRGVTKQRALYKDKRNRIKKMSKRTRAILEKIERELRSGEFTLTSPSKAARLKRAAATNESAFMRPSLDRASVHPLPSTMRQLHRRASLKEDDLSDDNSILRSSSLASADPVRVAAFLESSLARNEPLLEFDRLSPIKRHSAIGGRRDRKESGAAGKATTGWRDDVLRDSRMDKTVDTTHDSSFSDGGDSDAISVRSNDKGYRQQAARSPRSEIQAHRGALHMANKSEEDSSDLEDHSRSRPLDVAEVSQREAALFADGIASFKDPIYPTTNDTIHRRPSHYNHSANNGPYADHRLSRVVGPQSGELMSVSQFQPQYIDRSRKASSIAVGSRGADSEDEEDRLNEGQADVSAQSQSGNRRLSRSEGPQSRQAMSVPQQQRRVTGGGRDNEYEDEGGTGVERDDAAGDWASADHRLSQSLGPRTGQSQSQSQLQSQSQRQRGDISRRQTTAADDGGGRRNEYTHEDGLGVESGEFGVESQSADRRSSRSVGRSQSMVMSQQAKQQRGDVSQKPTMRSGAGRSDEFEDGNGSEVESAYRRITRSVGQQSVSVSRLNGVDSSREVNMAAGSARDDQFDGEIDFGAQQGGAGTATRVRGRRTSQSMRTQGQLQSQRVNPSRKPSMVTGGGRSDEDGDGDGFGIDQRTDGAASQSAGPRLSHSAGPHSRKSMSVPQVNRGDTLLKSRMAAQTGHGDEYADEDDFDIGQEDAGGASQDTSRRSVNPQNRSPLSVPQHSHSQTSAGQQQQHKAAGVSRKSGMAHVGDDEEHEEGTEQEHSDEGVQSPFANRRSSRPVGLQGHQSIPMTQLQGLQSQQKQLHGDTSRNQNMLTRGGRRGSLESTEDFGVDQGDSQPANRRLSRSAQPQSRPSIAVSQQVEQQRVDASRKVSMAAGVGRGDEDEYDHEISIGIDQRALSQSGDRRLSRLGGEQSRQSLSASLPRGALPRKHTMTVNADRDDEFDGGSGDFGVESQSAGRGFSQSTDHQNRRSMSTSNLQHDDVSWKQSMGLKAAHFEACKDEDKDDFDIEQDEIRAPSQVINRRSPASPNPQSRQSLSVPQQPQSRFQFQQIDASQKPSVVTVGGNEECDDGFGVDQGDVFVESPSEGRRFSRSIGPQSRQSMSLSQQQDFQSQALQQQRGDSSRTSRKQSMMTVNGRSSALEDADDFRVGQGDASADSQFQVSQSVGPQSRPSVTVTRQAEQHRVGAPRKLRMAAGAGREYENEHGVGLGNNQRGGGVPSQCSRRESRWVGPHHRQSLSTPPQQRVESQSMATHDRCGNMKGFEVEQDDSPANSQSAGHRLSQSTGCQTQSMAISNLQSVDASWKHSMGLEAGQNEAYKDENADDDEDGFDVDQGDVPATFQSANRRESQLVGRPSRQSMPVPLPRQSHVCRGGAPRKPDMVTGSGHGGDYEDGDDDESDIEQDEVRGAPQVTNRDSSRAVNPQHRQSLSVSQQKPVEVVQKQSVSSGLGGGGDDYADEDGFGVDRGRGGFAAQSADRRLSQSKGPQSRQLMTVSQVQRPSVDPLQIHSTVSRGDANGYGDEKGVEHVGGGVVSQSGDHSLSRSEGSRIFRPVAQEQESEVVNALRKDGHSSQKNESSPVRVTAQAMKKLFTGYPAEDSDEYDDRETQWGDTVLSMNFVDQADARDVHGTSSGQQRRPTTRTTGAMMGRESVDSSRAQFRSMPQLAKLLEAVDEAVGRSDGSGQADLHSRRVSRQVDPELTQGRSTQDGHEPFSRYDLSQHEPSPSQASLSGHTVRNLNQDASRGNERTDTTKVESDGYAITALYRGSLQDHHVDVRSERKLSERSARQVVNKQPSTSVRGRALSNRNVLSTHGEADEEMHESDDGESIIDGVDFELSRVIQQHDYLSTTSQPENRVSRNHRQRDNLKIREVSNSEKDTDTTRQPEDPYVVIPSRLTSRESHASDQAQHAIDRDVARKHRRSQGRNHSNRQSTSADRSGESLADKLSVNRESRSGGAHRSEKLSDSDYGRDRRELSTRASGDAIVNEEELWGDDGGVALETYSRHRRLSRAVDSQTPQSGSYSRTTTEERAAGPTQREGEDLEEVEENLQRSSRRRTASVAVHHRGKSTADEQHDESMVEARRDTAVLFAEGVSSFSREHRESETPHRRRTRWENRQSRREMNNDLLDADVQARTYNAETWASRPHLSSRPVVSQEDEYRDREDYTAEDDPSTRGRRTRHPGDEPSTKRNNTASQAKNAERSSRLQALDKIDDGRNQNDGVAQVPHGIAQQWTRANTGDDELGRKDDDQRRMTRSTPRRETPRATSEVHAEGVASFADGMGGCISVPQRSHATSEVRRPPSDHDARHSMHKGEQQQDHRSSSRSAAHETREGRRRHLHQRSAERGDRDTVATLFQEGVASYVDEMSANEQYKRLTWASVGDRQRPSPLESHGADVDERLGEKSEDRGGVADRRSHSLHRGRHGELHEHSNQRTRLQHAVSETELERDRFDASEHTRVEPQVLVASRNGRRSQLLDTDDPEQNEPKRVLGTVKSSTRAQSHISNQVGHDAQTHRSIRPSSAVDVRVHPVMMEVRVTRNSYDSNQAEADRAAASHDRQLPPPPHPTMAGGAGRDYQKFRDASNHGKIVWPPGMEDEATRVPTYRAKHGHPLVPPGMDHLVSDEQLVEYWTWLHWYSCWQLYYLETSSSHKKKQKKKTRATPLASDTMQTRGVAANWYINLSDSKLR